MLLVRDADLIELGEPPSDSRYVGVAYADGIWQFQSDPSWDRGFLTRKGGCLLFKGLASSFLLPMEMVKDVVVLTSVKTLTGQSHRVFVYWRDEDDRLNTLSLEVRDAGDSSKLESKTLGLADWLKAEGEGEPLPLPSPEKLPFRSVLLDFNSVPSEQTIQLSDRILGGIAFVVCVAALAAIAILIHIPSSYIGGVSAIFGFGCYHMVVLHRVRSRASGRAPKTAS